MKPDILISVIVPIYKVEQLLPRCVDSIQAQTYTNLEIILVDDGSPDRCGQICDEYAKQDARIRVIHKPNGGLSSARNAGIDVAKGDYLAFVDSDDWIEPGAYEGMLQMALEEDVKMVCGGRFDTGDGFPEKQVGLCPPVREVVSSQEVLRRIFLWENLDSAAWDKLYHRSLFQEIRYPVGKICEDVPTTYRIALLAERIGMYDQPVYNYYHRSGSITTASVSEKTFHLPEHTAQICPYICANYPALEKEVRYFRVRSLLYVLQVIDLAKEEDQRKYAQQYQKYRNDLREHLSFALGSPLFSLKERTVMVLLSAGLYRGFRKVYSRLKRQG